MKVLSSSGHLSMYSGLCTHSSHSSALVVLLDDGQKLEGGNLGMCSASMSQIKASVQSLEQWEWWT